MMSAITQNYILAPRVVSVSFDTEPAYNALESLILLSELKRLSGLGEWVQRTAAALSPERAYLNKLVFLGLDALFRGETQPPIGCPDFPAYIDWLAGQDPYRLRESMLGYILDTSWIYGDYWDRSVPMPTADQLLSDRATFAAYVRAAYNHPEVDDDRLVSDMHALLNDPPRLLATALEHMRHMWEAVMQPEWMRCAPMVEESAAAFRRLTFDGLTVHEAIRTVTGRDVRAWNDPRIGAVEQVIFVPSAHVGPYITKQPHGSTTRVLFGARLPRGAAVTSSDLSRAELLIRLNALSDDTRLRILELLTRHDELCAQEIIERLDVSQSSASRHLKELSANGYITERRRDVAKCYSLNSERVVDTLRALTNFLSRQP